MVLHSYRSSPLGGREKFFSIILVLSVTFALLCRLGDAFTQPLSSCSKVADVDVSSSRLLALPNRKRKHNHRKGKKGTKSTVGERSRGSEINEEELKQHILKEYTFGTGGVLSKPRRKREKIAPSIKNSGHNIQHLQMLDQHPALVLNADYQPFSYLPLSMWHWQDVVKAVFSGKVTVVEVYPDVNIRAANIEVPLPSVIALNEYVPQPNSRPAFTKRNVFLRDEYRCQYCSKRFHTKDLSLDHVYPRSMGGGLNWENAVTCCLKCNGRKGSLTVNQLKQVGMRLMREPYVPTQFQLHTTAGKMLPRRLHPSWIPFLYGYAESVVSDTAEVTTTSTNAVFFNTSKPVII